jgi:plastocyanin
MIRTRRIPIAVGLATAIALGGHGAMSTAAGTKTITVKDDLFSPKKVTISKNTLVTWKWASDAGSHNVTSRGTKRFKSSHDQSGGVYRYRFKKAGTYKYVCTIHVDEGMTGTIVVR